jgi:hypothetical protein
MQLSVAQCIKVTATVQATSPSAEAYGAAEGSQPSCTAAAAELWSVVDRNSTPSRCIALGAEKVQCCDAKC